MLAESCTAGAAAAALGAVPGISRWFCGSAVTYRPATKTAWLNVPAEMVEHCSAESEPVARTMATAALEHTPEADVAASIVGHLGPDVPPEADGVVFIGCARPARGAERAAAMVLQRRLCSSGRSDRQAEAAALLLEAAADWIGGAAYDDGAGT